MTCNEQVETVAWNVWIPVFGWWGAAEKLGPKIAEQVTGNKKHRCPGEVLERSTHTKKTNIEEKNSLLVTEKTAQIYRPGDVKPLQIVY